ncbi:MAG: hypothetical protein WCO13_03130 [Bacteroidota bacterium]
MNVKKKPSNFYSILLKTGVIFFLFGIAYQLFFLTAGVKNFEDFSKILTIVLFLGISIFVLAIPKRIFRILVFILTFIISVFKIILLLSKEVIDIEIISVYFLIISLSLFLLSKSTQHTHRS